MRRPGIDTLNAVPAGHFVRDRVNLNWSDVTLLCWRPRLVHSSFEVGEQLQDVIVGEGQKLCHYDAGHVLGRVNPEIGVEEPSPRDAACASTCWSRFRVDIERQPLFLDHAREEIGVI